MSFIRSVCSEIEFPAHSLQKMARPLCSLACCVCVCVCVRGCVVVCCFVRINSECLLDKDQQVMGPLHVLLRDSAERERKSREEHTEEEQKRKRQDGRR